MQRSGRGKGKPSKLTAADEALDDEMEVGGARRGRGRRGPVIETGELLDEAHGGDEGAHYERDMSQLNDAALAAVQEPSPTPVATMTAGDEEAWPQVGELGPAPPNSTGRAATGIRNFDLD